MANEPITREEMLLNAVATGEATNLEPITREEMFLAKLGGADVTTPTPITRKEQFLQKAIDGGGSSGIGPDYYIEAQRAEVVLPNATAIKPYAFATDTVLSSVSMPKVKNIGTSGFSQCSNLVITNFHEGLERIDGYAFMACQKFVVISFPTSMKFIGDRAFYNCSEIKTVTFKTKPGTIGSTAFSGCGNLKTINVPWAENEVVNAPWGATNATINYNYKGE